MNPKIDIPRAQGNDQAAEAAPCWACERPATLGRYCPDCAEKVEQAKAERVQLEANPRYQAIRNRVRAAMARLYAAQAQAARDRRHAGRAYLRAPSRPRPRGQRKRGSTPRSGNDPPSEPDPAATISPIVPAWFAHWLSLAYPAAAPAAPSPTHKKSLVEALHPESVNEACNAIEATQPTKEKEPPRPPKTHQEGKA